MSMIWAAVAMGIGGGLSAYGKSQQKTTNKLTQLPEYPEADASRKQWWERLQTWGADPNYGAISPDWNSIWEATQRKVTQFYEGGPLEPGMKARLKSSLARRGMSENPASDYMLSAMDAKKYGELKDLSVAQNKDQADRVEAGRQYWGNSMADLSKQKPSFIQTSETKNPAAWANILGSAVSAGGQAYTLGNMFSAPANAAGTGLNSSMLPNQMPTWQQQIGQSSGFGGGIGSWTPLV